MKYKEAMQELEQILVDVNNEATDIDELASKLARATELIKFCKEKLRDSEKNIQDILGD